MPELLPTATVATALGAGTVGGVFFAFSTFIMPGLRQLSDPESVRSMQAINRTAVTPPFMIALFGTGLLCVVLGIYGLRHLDVLSGKLLLAGAATYVITGVIVTIAANVPLNDRLAKADANTAAWNEFVGSWTAWNHVRTVGCLVACVLLVLAARTASTTSDNRAAASVSRSAE